MSMAPIDFQLAFSVALVVCGFVWAWAYLRR